jgi:hypothetical protein
MFEPVGPKARRLGGSGVNEFPLGLVLRLGLDSLGLGRDHARLLVLAPLLVPLILPFLPFLGMAHAALTSFPKL